MRVYDGEGKPHQDAAQNVRGAGLHLPLDTRSALRWLSFILLAYVMLGLQVGLYAFAPINFVLIAVVFIVVNATREPAVIACFILGVLHDLIVGAGPIGQYALAYCCVALLVAGDERAIASDHPATHFLVTLFGSIIVAIVLKILSVWHGIGTSILTDLLTGFYTAIAAVVVLYVLSKLRKKFRFRTSIGR
jgi:rod shape-determining protein MreD